MKFTKALFWDCTIILYIRQVSVPVAEKKLLHVVCLVVFKGHLGFFEPLGPPVLPGGVGVGGPPRNYILKLGVGQRVLVHEPTDH